MKLSYCGSDSVRLAWSANEPAVFFSHIKLVPTLSHQLSSNIFLLNKSIPATNHNQDKGWHVAAGLGHGSRAGAVETAERPLGRRRRPAGCRPQGASGRELGKGGWAVGEAETTVLHGWVGFACTLNQFGP